MLILFVVIIVFFSDIFFDASFDLYRVPVRETACECLKQLALVPLCQRKAEQIIFQLHTRHDWNPSEEWIWLYDLALATQVINHRTPAMIEMALEWFQKGDYATQGITGNLICSWLHDDASIVPKNKLDELGEFVVQQLCSHNFLSEWNCALKSYFIILSHVVPKENTRWLDVVNCKIAYVTLIYRHAKQSIQRDQKIVLFNLDCFLFAISLCFRERSGLSMHSASSHIISS